MQWSAVSIKWAEFKGTPSCTGSSYDIRLCRLLRHLHHGVCRRHCWPRHWQTPSSGQVRGKLLALLLKFRYAASHLHALFVTRRTLLVRVAVLRGRGLLLQTEERGLSVCRSVCLSRLWALWKRLNRSRYRLVGSRKHMLDGGHIGATWRIRLNRPCAAVMRPSDKLLLSLVRLWSTM